MIEKILAVFEKLDALDQQLFTPKNEVVRARDVLYFFSSDGKTYARRDDDSKVELRDSLNALEARFSGSFLRCQRFYLIRFDRIMGISRRYAGVPTERVDVPVLPKCLTGAGLDVHLNFCRSHGMFRSTRHLRDRTRDYKFHLYGSKRTVPISSGYHDSIKKALGIQELSHLTPEDPWLKKLRLLRIKDFGLREFKTIDPTDPQQVAAFKREWDIREFSREKMLVHFRQVGASDIDKPLVIKNILWQCFRWIKWGIERQVDGNIRTLWYRVKSLLAQHSDVLGNNDVDTFYYTLTSMVEKEELFRYKDFGFYDVNEPYRIVGSRRPEIIIASEKLGDFRFVRRLALQVGASFICLGGEPSHLSLEYFSDDLKDACGEKPVHVFIISDIDPAGFSIESNLIKRLRFNGVKVGRRVALVDLDIFTGFEIKMHRTPVVRYRQKGNKLTPLPPAKMGQLTKAMEWFFGVLNDERLFGKVVIDGQETFVIYGLSCDMADLFLVEQRFLAEVGKLSA